MHAVPDACCLMHVVAHLAYNWYLLLFVRAHSRMQTNNFVDLLKMVVTLKVFVRLLRLKLESLKVRGASTVLYCYTLLG